MGNDVIYNKIEIIERCLHRIREVYGDAPQSLMDYTKQDSIILNMQRACEASIDLAMHIVSEKHLGLPQSSRDAFDILARHEMIDEELSKNLKAMIGFRNIAVHDYQSINIEILRQIIEHHLDDFRNLIHHINKI